MTRGKITNGAPPLRPTGSGDPAAERSATTQATQPHGFSTKDRLETSPATAETALQRPTDGQPTDGQLKPHALRALQSTSDEEAQAPPVDADAASLESLTTNRGCRYVIERLADLAALRAELGLAAIDYGSRARLAADSWLSLGEGDSDFIRCLIDQRRGTGVDLSDTGDLAAVDLVYGESDVQVADVDSSWDINTGLQNARVDWPNYVAGSYADFDIPAMHSRFSNIIAIHALDPVFDEPIDPAAVRQVFDNIGRHIDGNGGALMVFPAPRGIEPLLANLRDQGSLRDWRQDPDKGLVVVF